MQCGWLGNDRDGGCSPEVRFMNMPNISNHKVVKLGGDTPHKVLRGMSLLDLYDYVLLNTET